MIPRLPSGTLRLRNTFRLSIVVGFAGYTLFLLLPLVLYKLLSPVNKTHAVLMVALSAVSVPISLVNLLNKLAVLTLIGDATYRNVYSSGQLEGQVMFHLDSYSNGNMVASLFWGLWLLPFGYLVFKSGFLPKIIGVLLMFGVLWLPAEFWRAFLLSKLQ